MSFQDPTPSPSCSSLTSTVYNHPVLIIGTILTAVYFSWYHFVVVRRPLLYGGRDRLRDHLLSQCRSLSQPYRPTIWAWHYHGTTIIRPLIQKLLPIQYNRQMLHLPDGGQIGLDWAKRADTIDNTVLLIIPGLSGDSSINYVQHFVQDGLEAGHICVVFNQRGMGNIPLTSPCMVSANNTRDLEAVIDAINKSYPNASIIALGVSLGGIILTNYLHCAGGRSKISSCMTISTPWDVELSRHSVEEKTINRLLYVNFLLGRLRNVVRKNVTELAKHPSVNIERAMNAKTFTEFDDALTAPSNGYESCEQYYEESCIHDKVKNIQVPFICVMAMDDPFSPTECIPIDAFESNPNTVLVLTRHGGHFGFIEGVYPRGRSWMNKVFFEFLLAMK
ncbi:PREDICTED: phospholipase ABHD3-like [Amphimedon queenslandica]|uniref:AB hydrolase-1 domain-containing protein n=1 Tax=Amphimedon queenslandica TaxID=400682 RepID=A0A1X7V8Q6_AMPQE|nr:PREDICTED: phospholipase ABHD3-like [Amphimedon queenslandica]|eukprot:XP_019850275.1 PREDICTED: phospholipase ABHD3-like [Amphimedon queenslandica]